MLGEFDDFTPAEDGIVGLRLLGELERLLTMLRRASLTRLCRVLAMSAIFFCLPTLGTEQDRLGLFDVGLTAGELVVSLLSGSG